MSLPQKPIVPKVDTKSSGTKTSSWSGTIYRSRSWSRPSLGGVRGKRPGTRRLRAYTLSHMLSLTASLPWRKPWGSIPHDICRVYYRTLFSSHIIIYVVLRWIRNWKPNCFLYPVKYAETEQVFTSWDYVRDVRDSSEPMYMGYVLIPLFWYGVMAVVTGLIGVLFP